MRSDGAVSRVSRRFEAQRKFRIGLVMGPKRRMQGKGAAYRWKNNALQLRWYKNSVGRYSKAPPARAGRTDCETDRCRSREKEPGDKPADGAEVSETAEYCLISPGSN